jgi:hypothetical protein
MIVVWFVHAIVGDSGAIVGGWSFVGVGKIVGRLLLVRMVDLVLLERRSRGTALVGERGWRESLCKWICRTPYTSWVRRTGKRPSWGVCAFLRTRLRARRETTHVLLLNRIWLWRVAWQDFSKATVLLSVVVRCNMRHTGRLAWGRRRGNPLGVQLLLGSKLLFHILSLTSTDNLLLRSTIRKVHVPWLLLVHLRNAAHSRLLHTLVGKRGRKRVGRLACRDRRYYRHCTSIRVCAIVWRHLGLSRDLRRHGLHLRIRMLSAELARRCVERLPWWFVPRRYKRSRYVIVSCRDFRSLVLRLVHG